jgi:hypothetical protein
LPSCATPRRSSPRTKVGALPGISDGAIPRKKTARDSAGKTTSVVDYNLPSHKQECTQRYQFVRSILVTGETKDQVISSLLIESSSAVVGDDGHEREKMKWTFERKAGETTSWRPW